MNKVADKIMPKELAKVMPYIAMAAPFFGSCWNASNTTCTSISRCKKITETKL